MRFRLEFILTMGALLWASTVAAQTTQPAPAAWGQLISNLSQSIIDESGAVQTAAMVGDDVIVRGLDGNQNHTRYHLLQRTQGLTIISSRVYTWPAETIATDLGADFKAFDNFPATLRKQFCTREEKDQRDRANSIARQWLAASLDPSANDLIAVLVLWEAPAPVTSNLLLGNNAAPEIKQPLFVLIKGKQKGESDAAISQIVFGDALQALK
ncbi:MAG TPA: hypothetical protein VHD56_04315 [Tepidisphaeraceae bacterium]|nr:hypothetical protein [Tepidisphaeraceae bacterium]